MSNGHESDDEVRRYLLGTLDEPDADALEERYFTDPACLRAIETVERELIEDYLAQRLNVADRTGFESRYLALPELRAKVEKIEREMGPRASPVGPRQFWRYALAAVALGILALGIWGLLRSRANPETVAVLRLAPGVLKSADGAASAQWDRTLGNVQLLLELPGARPGPTSVRVSAPEPDGSLRAVWQSPVIEPYPTPTGSEYPVTMDVKIIVRGDYIVHILDSESKILETYSFRAK